eukprot:jgi/Psemu1/250553/estExt_Genewise1Plus.C_180172
MIIYDRSAFGWRLIFRAHGSAVYRSVLPSAIAVAIFFLYRKFNTESTGIGNGANDILHPYAVGVLVSSATFLLIFKLSQAYNRYWEACGSTHHFMSKWMDATTHTGSYHMQCDHYNHIKPPSFFDYPQLNALFMTRDRERSKAHNSNRPQDPEDGLPDPNDGTGLRHRRQFAPLQTPQQEREEEDNDNDNPSQSMSLSRIFEGQKSEPIPLVGKPRLDGNWGAYYTEHESQPLSTYMDPLRVNKIDPKGFASIQGGRTPPLFLQELAHLSSLLTAVALSTLRNDVEGCESPLSIYEPGEPWPEVDPNNEEWMKKSPLKAFCASAKAFLGVGLTAEQRSKYNAALPLPVIGGVSDAEIRLLQIARGPYAKTQLCFSWLTEFIIREHLAGTLGAVGPPIISRIVQFLGDGMIYYNHARKIMFIPFPFGHAQISVIFVVIMVAVVPFLMHQYTDEPLVGAILTFLTVLCIEGINEVARDLENPFRNFPNELPVTTFQAQYNEALLTMYAGYHPDHFWHGDQVMRMAQSQSATTPKPKPTKSHKTNNKEARNGGLAVIASRGDLEASLGDFVMQENPAATTAAGETNSAQGHAKPNNNSTEVDALIRKLEDQSNLIEELFAKIGSIEASSSSAAAAADTHGAGIATNAV